MTRVQLTDEEWEFIGPYLPIGEYGPYPERLRQQFEGVIWRFKTGGQWREMLQEFGAWSNVSKRFHQWRDADVFEALCGEGRCRGGEGQVKGGSREEQSGRDAEAEPEWEERRRVRRRRKLRLKAALLGRSRGGQTSKIHVAADRKCRPLTLLLTVGQAADSPQFIPVPKKIRVRGPVGRPRTRPDAVARGKAYSSRGNRAYLCKRQIQAVIPEKKDQAANRKKKGSRGGRPIGHDAELYKARNTVERLVNKLKAWRGLATRYDKTPESYLAGLHLRASMIWIKDLRQST
ncbi:IS5 family transposase [Streptomyces sp. NPDC051452]|uniref:IS5 family transposase n=1 Tax=Streptomyces sp. NPDC051452 TaxID=3365654 RepID=UPI003791591D